MEIDWIQIGGIAGLRQRITKLEGIVEGFIEGQQ